MGMFYSMDQSGTQVEYRSEAHIAGSPPGPPPANRIWEKRFDEVTNASLVALFSSNTQAFTMPAGTVMYQENPVEFVPNGAYFDAKLRAPALLDKLKNSNDAFSREDIADIAAIAFHGDGLPSS